MDIFLEYLMRPPGLLSLLLLVMLVIFIAWGLTRMFSHAQERLLERESYLVTHHRPHQVQLSALPTLPIATYQAMPNGVVAAIDSRGRLHVIDANSPDEIKWEYKPLPSGRTVKSMSLWHANDLLVLDSAGHLSMLHRHKDGNFFWAIFPSIAPPVPGEAPSAGEGAPVARDDLSTAAVDRPVDNGTTSAPTGGAL